MQKESVLIYFKPCDFVVRALFTIKILDWLNVDVLFFCNLLGSLSHVILLLGNDDYANCIPPVRDFFMPGQNFILHSINI